MAPVRNSEKPSTDALRAGLLAARSMRHIPSTMNALDTDEAVNENEKKLLSIETDMDDEEILDKKILPQHIFKWILFKGSRLLLIAILKMALATLICLAVVAPRYERGPETKGQSLSKKQSRYAFGRCIFGTLIGRIIALIVRSIGNTEIVAEVMPLAILFDALEVLPLEIFSSTCGLLISPPIARLCRIALVFGGKRLHRAIRQRLRKFLVTILVLSVTYIFQRILMSWSLRRWTAEKFAEKVASALACRRVVNAMAEVAEIEKERRGNESKNDQVNDDEDTLSKASTMITGLFRRHAKLRQETAESHDKDEQTKEQKAQDTSENDVKNNNIDYVKVSARYLVDDDNLTETKNLDASDGKKINKAYLRNSFGGYEKATRKLRNALNLSGFGILASSEDSRKIGKHIFRFIRSAVQGRSSLPLDRQSLKELLLGSEGPLGNDNDTERKIQNEAAFDELFPPAVTQLSETDVVEPFLRVYRERSFLSATIQSFGSINRMLVRLAEVVWSLLALVFILILWKVDVTDVILVFGTFSIGLSYAFGSTFAQIGTGMSYVLFTNPYDIGDRVIIGEVGSMATDFPMFVTSIDPYTTTFRTSFGEIITVANYILSQKSILNHGRSVNPSLRCTLKLSMRTPPAEISKLCGALKQFGKVHKSDWTDIGLYFSAIQHDLGALVLDIWASSRYSYQDFNNLYSSRTQLYLFIHAYIHAANIHFAAPMQPVEIHNYPQGFDQPPSAPSSENHTPSLRFRSSARTSFSATTTNN